MGGPVDFLRGCVGDAGELGRGGFAGRSGNWGDFLERWRVTDCTPSLVRGPMPVRKLVVTLADFPPPPHEPRRSLRRGIALTGVVCVLMYSEN